MAEQFSGWAVVEVLGHNKYVGQVEEVVLAGAGMLKVSVPEVPATGPYSPGIRAFVKYVPPTALYALTPITEEEAMRAIGRVRATPHNIPMIAAPAYSDQSDEWNRPPRDEEDGGEDMDDDDIFADAPDDDRSVPRDSRHDMARYE
jgi:hypothetical protein